MLESMPVILKFTPLLFLFHFLGFNPFFDAGVAKNIPKHNPDVLKGNALNESEILYG